MLVKTNDQDLCHSKQLNKLISYPIGRTRNANKQWNFHYRADAACPLCDKELRAEVDHPLHLFRPFKNPQAPRLALLFDDDDKTEPDIKHF